MSRHSTYRGWTLHRPGVTGWWRATRSGECRLLADTLAGLREIVSRTEVRS